MNAAMRSAVEAHRRQFVVGPTHALVGPRWQTVILGDELVLSHCPTLPVKAAGGRDGTTWHLIGLAFQGDPTAPDPLEQIAGLASDEVPIAYHSWLGRWILVRDAELHMDAGGTLGCFCRVVHGRAQEEVWVSSSAAILAELPARAPLRTTAPPIVHGRGMYWYPPPKSRYAGVERLLVSQVLDLRAGPAGVRPRPLLPAGPPAPQYGQTLDVIERTLVTGLRNVARHVGDLWLPLTAGLDSRLLLAASVAAGVRVRTFTQARSPLTMPTGDRDIPPALSRRLGLEHHYLRPGRPSPADVAVLDAHTGGNTVNQDRQFVLRGQWQPVPPSALVLRGGVFETGRCHYHRRFPTEEVDDLGATIAGGFAFDRFHRRSFPHAEGLAEWLAWSHRHPEPGLDWRDRLYLEQRVGGWLSATEQALDALDCDMVNPAACHLVLATARDVPADLRRTGRHHEDLIGRMAPTLLEFPFNPPDPAPVRRLRAARARVGTRLAGIRSTAERRMSP